MIRFILVPFLFAAIVACDQWTPTSAQPEERRARAAAVAYPHSDLERVGAALATALQDPSARVHVRNAMRQSPLTEHKLVLQEFVRTPAGNRVLVTASKRSGIPLAELLASVDGLPLLDFYVPFPLHRRTWKGDENFILAWSSSVDADTVAGQNPVGGRVSLALRAGEPSATLLMLHPAERKSRRIHPQPRERAGDVIQDADDGELSGSLSLQRADGTMWEMELASLADCGPEDIDCSGSGGGGSSPADTTYVTYLEVNYDDGVGGNEVELRAKFYVGGSLVAQGTLRQEGVYRYAAYHPNRPILFQRIRQGSTDRIAITVVETDQFVNDPKGSRNFTVGDRGVIRTIASNGNETDTRLDWTPKN